MYLAQLNIAKALDEKGSAQMKGFYDRLDEVNAIAEQHPGFIWRFKDEEATAQDLIQFPDPRILVNMSVWQTPDHLKQFMFKTSHLEMMKQKHSWFEKIDQASYVMWWIDEGIKPTLAQAKLRLAYLRECGTSAYAFDFKNIYPAQDVTQAEPEVDAVC